MMVSSCVTTADQGLSWRAAARNEALWSAWSVSQLHVRTLGEHHCHVLVGAVRDPGPITFSARVGGEVTVTVDGLIVLDGRGATETSKLAAKAPLTCEEEVHEGRLASCVPCVK